MCPGNVFISYNKHLALLSFWSPCLWVPLYLALATLENIYVLQPLCTAQGYRESKRILLIWYIDAMQQKANKSMTLFHTQIRSFNGFSSKAASLHRQGEQNEFSF